jgi:hypothetical protein
LASSNIFWIRFAPNFVFAKPHSIPGQIAQISLFLLGYITSSQKAMLEEICNPLAISDISLAPGYLLDVLSVDQQQLSSSSAQTTSRVGAQEPVPELMSTWLQQLGVSADRRRRS